jgi:hypothetical protein
VGNKWRFRRGAQSAQLPMRFNVAIFGFVVHAANFQPGGSEYKEIKKPTAVGSFFGKLYTGVGPWKYRAFNRVAMPSDPAIP